MARKVIAITTLGFGALLLLLGWVWRLSAPQLSYVAPEEIGFFAAVSGAALFATGLVLCLIRTAHARRVANYFSALLLVPGVMSGVGLALAASFLDPPMPDTSLAWLLCGLATCCGLLITISTVEPAEPLVDRVERIIAETGPALGIMNKQKIGLGASLHVLRQVAPLIVLLVGFVGFLVWKDVKVVPWIALGLPIALGGFGSA